MNAGTRPIAQLPLPNPWVNPTRIESDKPAPSKMRPRRRSLYCDMGGVRSSGGISVPPVFGYLATGRWSLETAAFSCST